MTENETKKLIDEIINNANGFSWNFIKTQSSTNDFVDYLKGNKLEKGIRYFSISSPNEPAINSIINWTKKQFDAKGNPLYRQDFNLILTTNSSLESKFTLIFFKVN